MTDFEKVVAAHDWVVAHCKYDPLQEFLRRQTEKMWEKQIVREEGHW